MINSGHLSLKKQIDLSHSCSPALKRKENKRVLKIKEIIDNCNNLQNEYAPDQHFSQHRYVNKVQEISQDLAAHMIR